MRRAAVLALALLVAAPRLVTAQADRERGAAALGELIRGLGVTSRVLMIGAHPDDEDTQLITWLARGRGVETAYLSLTRGDGGQNLIGNELGEALGVIRTEELLAARRIDGGRQYFTRAYDFGFSKSAEETYRHWPKDSILRDVVTVVRAFRPHVIVSVFSGTPRDGHGHHQVAGLLAREAYELAGDTVRMPQDASLWGSRAWTPLKFYRSARFAPDSATLRFNVGEYNALLGRSYAELAAESRSQHKSQGFGVLGRRGVIWDHLRREATRVNAHQDPRTERSIFDGIDTSLARLRAQVPARHWATLDSLARAVQAVEQLWRLGGALEDPTPLLSPLTRVHRLAARLDELTRGSGYDYVSPCPDSALDTCSALATIGERAVAAMRPVAGIAVEATAPQEVYAVGSTFPVTVTVYNRGRKPATLLGGYAWPRPDSVGGQSMRVPIPPDSAARVTFGGEHKRATQPWWLVRPRLGDVFDVRVEQPSGGPYAGIGREESARGLAEAVVLDVVVGADTVFLGRIPVVRRFADPIRGEVERPVVGVPAITVTLDRQVEYARANALVARALRVTVRSAADTARAVDVTLALPRGLTADAERRRVTVPARGAVTITFDVRGSLPPGRHTLTAGATSAGQTYETGYVAIDYDHIRPQRVFRRAALELEAVDITLPATLAVAYLPGVGDNVAPTIEQLGIPVTMIGAAALPSLEPARTPVLVIGPRAYESNDTLVANAASVLDFVRRGGTVVVQYGQHEMTRPGIMPYPITIERRADRVTEEDAPVRMLDPASPVLSHPNRITDRDFAGWVQERALYMPRTFDPRYHAPLSMNDPGEPPNQGAILVAPVGRGTYVYTTLAFFRQLPAGHPGAARLFVNLLAAGQRPTPR